MPAEPRHLRVVGIQHAVGEGQQGRQHRVLHVGQDQVREAAARATSAAGSDRAGPPDTRTASAAAEEAGVLQVVPAARAQGQFVEPAARARARWRRRTEAAPSAGWVKPREAAGATAATAAAGRPSTMRIGRGKPRSRGNSGAPSQSSGGATIISSRCCTMWTCSSKRGERLDRRGQRQEDGGQPAEEGGEPAAVPAMRVAAAQDEPAAQIDRGRQSSSEARSQGSNGQERRKASSVGLMARSLLVAACVGRLGRRLARPAAGSPGNRPGPSSRPGLICLP